MCRLMGCTHLHSCAIMGCRGAHALRHDLLADCNMPVLVSCSHCICRLPDVEARNKVHQVRPATCVCAKCWAQHSTICMLIVLQVMVSGVKEGRRTGSARI